MKEGYKSKHGVTFPATKSGMTKFMLCIGDNELMWHIIKRRR